ncbi:MAG: energy transducer TonB [Bacteroidetes bacterium]|nr:energy transducer TonB [Bacteroidota bacterium]
MHKPAKDKHFIKQPSYEGGPKALKKFIGENLRYPQEALENKVEGTVNVHYDIDYQGNVIDAKVVGGIGFGCDEEAIRLVKLLKFKVEKPRGLRILYHKTMQVHFRLPVVKEQPLQVQFSYVATATSASGNVAEEKKSSYTYQVIIGG